MSAEPSLVTSVPDAPENGEVVVRLIAGASALSEMAFPIGRAAPLVSVGARGDWQVRGGDVAPVHVVLAFNGEGLFACIREGSRLAIDGARVTSSGWVPVPVGATLELGEVRLTVMTSRGGGPASTPAPPSSVPTRAMRLTRARSGEVPAWPTLPRIRRRAESFGTTQLVPPMRRDARPVDASLAGSFGTTQLVPPIVRDGRASMPPARASSPGERRPSSPIRLPATDSYSDAPPPVAPAGPRALVPMDPRAGGGARPAAIESFGVTRMVPPMAWRAPLGAQRASPMFDSFAPTRLAPPLASANVSGGHPLPDPMLGSMLGAASPKGAGPTAIAPAPAAGPSASAHRAAGSFVRAWRSSSQPRKAVVVLLGPALFAAVFSLRGSAAPAHAPSMPPVASPATAQVSAAPAPSASEANADAARTRGTTTSGNASLGLAPEPTAVERDPPAAAAEPPAVVLQASAGVGPRPASSSKAAQRKTVERRALDAVAAGAGDADLYDALAKENPDNPAFSEAARILRARASEAR